MGQAAVDLPDPLETPSSSVGVDDLLSQLAGDEIDRLLSDGETFLNEPPLPVMPAAPLPAGPSSDASAPEVDPLGAPEAVAVALHDAPPVVERASGDKDAAALSAEMDEAFEQLAGPEPQAPAALPSTITGDVASDVVASDAVASEAVAAPDEPQPPAEPLADASLPYGSLEDVFAELTAADAAKEGAAAPAPAAPSAVETASLLDEGTPAITPAASPGEASAAPVTADLTNAAAPAATTDPTTDPVSDEPAASAAERSALNLPALSEDASAADAEAEERTAIDAPLAPLPWFIRLLATLNAPLDACPDAVRDAVGKVALLTLFNAAAILVYVLFFRRH